MGKVSRSCTSHVVEACNQGLFACPGISTQWHFANTKTYFDAYLKNDACIQKRGIRSVVR